MDYARRPKHLRSGEPASGAHRPPRAPKAPVPGWRGALRRLFAFLRRHPRFSLGAALACLTLFAYTAGNYWWQEHRWRYILIHHTASDIGNLDYYKKFHVEQRGWSDIAYHFIVNNGSMNTTVGEIEESTLWKERRPNLSTRRWYANYFGIAVVLVGNFERHPPPPLQQEALITLLTNLARRYDIPSERIVGHREIQNTACPGKYMDMNEIRKLVANNLTK
jgi:hypothetical protein